MRQRNPRLEVKTSGRDAVLETTAQSSPDLASWNDKCCQFLSRKASLQPTVFQDVNSRHKCTITGGYNPRRRDHICKHGDTPPRTQRPIDRREMLPVINLTVNPYVPEAITTESLDNGATPDFRTANSRLSQDWWYGFEGLPPMSPDIAPVAARQTKSDWGSPMEKKAKLELSQRSFSTSDLVSASDSLNRESKQPFPLSSLPVSIFKPSGEWEAVIAVCDPRMQYSLLNQQTAASLGIVPLPLSPTLAAPILAAFSTLTIRQYAHNVTLKVGRGLGRFPITVDILIAPFEWEQADLIISFPMMKKLRNENMNGIEMSSLTSSPWTDVGSLGSPNLELMGTPHAGDALWLPDPSLECSLAPVTPPLGSQFPECLNGNFACIDASAQTAPGMYELGVRSYNLLEFRGDVCGNETVRSAARGKGLGLGERSGPLPEAAPCWEGFR